MHLKKTFSIQCKKNYDLRVHKMGTCYVENYSRNSKSNKSIQSTS